MLTRTNYSSVEKGMRRSAAKQNASRLSEWGLSNRWCWMPEGWDDSARPSRCLALGVEGLPVIRNRSGGEGGGFRGTTSSHRLLGRHLLRAAIEDLWLDECTSPHNLASAWTARATHGVCNTCLSNSVFLDPFQTASISDTSDVSSTILAIS